MGSKYGLLPNCCHTSSQNKTFDSVFLNQSVGKMSFILILVCFELGVLTFSKYECKYDLYDIYLLKDLNLKLMLRV